MHEDDLPLTLSKPMAEVDMKGVQEGLAVDFSNTKLGFWKTPSMEKEQFAIVVADEGGYTSFRVHDKAQWEEIKKRIDTAVEKHTK